MGNKSLFNLRFRSRTLSIIYRAWKIEIEETFVYKKVTNREFMAKSQLALNFIGYFSKRSVNHFSRIISPKELKRNPWKSMWFLFLSYFIHWYWVHLNKIKVKEKYFFYKNGGGLTLKIRQMYRLFACK